MIFDSPYGKALNPHPTCQPDESVPTEFVDQNLISIEHGPISTGDPWLPEGAIETVGNNVDAFHNVIEWDDELGYFDYDYTYDPLKGDFRASITSENTFDYPLDPTIEAFNVKDPDSVEPPDYDAQRNANIVNGFVVLNYLHDYFYDYGFDELGGNFQKSNYGRGGIENDPALIILNDYGTFANSGTADGESPYIYIGAGGLSKKNGSDFGLIAHEWGHNLIGRLIGNGSGLLTNQASSLNEGWADFIGLLLTIEPTDLSISENANYQGCYTTFAYYDSNPEVYETGTNEAYYFAHRRFPYSTDFNKNPLTFKYIEDGVDLPVDVPNHIFFWRPNNAEVHNSGQIWANTLLTAYRKLLKTYDFKEARHRMSQYFMSSLYLTPVEPTFIEARDAMLAAVISINPEDYDLFMNAFAERGMGRGAISPPRDSEDHAGVVESFEGSIPDMITYNFHRNAGSFDLKNISSIGYDQFKTKIYGLSPSGYMWGELFADTDPLTPFDDLNDGVLWHILTMGEDFEYFWESVPEETYSKFNFFMGEDLNGNGQPDADEVICSVQTDKADKECIVNNVKLKTLWVLFQNTDSDGSVEKAYISDGSPLHYRDNFWVTAPGSVADFEPYTMNLKWDVGDRKHFEYHDRPFLGLIEQELSPGHIRKTLVKFIQKAHDVNLTSDFTSVAPSQKIPMTVTVTPQIFDKNVRYRIVTVIPRGTRLDKSSLTQSDSDRLFSWGRYIYWYPAIDEDQDQNKTLNFTIKAKSNLDKYEELVVKTYHSLNVKDTKRQKEEVALLVEE